MTKSYSLSSVFFLLFFLAIPLFAIGLIHTSLFHENPANLSIGLTLDLVLLAPLLYFLAIRKTKISKLSIIPIFILCTFLASKILPIEHQGLLNLTKWLLFPIEIFVLGYFIIQVKRIRSKFSTHEKKEQSFLETLQLSLEEVMGKSIVSRLFTSEISLFYYCLFAWRNPLEVPENTTGFTLHKRAAYGMIVGVFFFIILIETLAMHLLIAQWSNTIAWVLSALSVYSLLFLFADYIAIRKRLTYFTNHQLHLNIGIRWRAIIKRQNIKSIQLKPGHLQAQEGLLRGELFGSPNVLIEFIHPVEFTGYYGIKKQVKLLTLSVDEAKQFSSCILQNV